MAKREITFDALLVEAEENLLIDVQFLIVDLISKKGLSRTELANRAGISKARLSQILSAEANPTLKSVAGIFHALGEELHVSSRKKRSGHDQHSTGGDFEWVADRLEVDPVSNAEMAAVVKEAVASNDNYKRQVVVWESEQETMQLEAA